jgi:NAD(P)-dependent dehydrogenase (short-subunit alcohol dehydrogenase family)
MMIGEVVFVITGGGSGIGRALAHALANRNKKVLVIGRRAHLLQETAKASPLITPFCADVSTREGRISIIEYLAPTKAIEGLVHNAGLIEPIVPIDMIDEASWQQVMAVNVEAPLFLTQHLRDKLTKGRLLTMGSAVAYFPVIGWSAYCVSKAALSMLTRCWQLECSEMATASVMPGIIDTPMQAQVRQASPSSMEPDKLDFYHRLKKEGRLVSPETVALFLCWLLLDIDKTTYVSKEWDIYDETHHHAWLKPPYTVPAWE